MAGIVVRMPEDHTVDAMELVRYATLAPSGHNTQPWKFSASHNVIRIYPDMTRRLEVVDADNHALYISLGCALENLLIAASAQGLAAAADYRPGCLQVTLAPDGGGDSRALFEAIPARQSNRRIYTGENIPDAHLRAMLAAGALEGVEVRAFRTDDLRASPIIELVREGNRLQFEDPAFLRELITWIRFSRTEIRRRRDGLTAASLGFPSIPRWLGAFILKTFVTAEAEAGKCERAIRASSVLLVFIAGRNDHRHWIDVGRSFERVALTATSLGIAHAHVNMPCEVVSVREKLAAQLGLSNAEQPLLLTRFGYAKPGPRAPRRPVADVLTQTW